VLQNPSRGPLLVLVRGTRIALGRGEAAKILVNEVEQGAADGG
jgi:Fe2+ transport system protein FeoA